MRESGQKIEFHGGLSSKYSESINYHRSADKRQNLGKAGQRATRRCVTWSGRKTIRLVVQFSCDFKRLTQSSLELCCSSLDDRHLHRVNDLFSGSVFCHRDRSGRGRRLFGSVIQQQQIISIWFMNSHETHELESARARYVAKSSRNRHCGTKWLPARLRLDDFRTIWPLSSLRPG